MTSRDQLSIEQTWENWKMCLKGDDKNSIFNQIALMLWDSAIFRIILESQKDRVEKNPQAPKLNQQLYSFIFRNYFHTQSAYIRRLTDKSSSLIGKKGTYSLGALLKDLQKHRDELTREKYIESRGFPYNYSTMKENETEFILNQPPGKAVSIPSELDWEPIRSAHETFDRLCKTNTEERHPNDLIDKSIFDRLQEKFEHCKKINEYVNKFVAHSATPESRQEFNVNEFDVTLKNLWDAQKIIFQISNFLSGVLFSIDHVPLAIEHPSFYDFWYEPFFEKEQAVDKVRETLEAYRKETEAWREASNENIWSWIEK
jgi:hypothetical protein